MDSNEEELRLIEMIMDLYQNRNVCKSHDIQHILRVAVHVKNALILANISDENIKRNIIYAALLHDVDDKKFFDTEDYNNTRVMLDAICLSLVDIDIIIRMISYVSVSTNGDKIPEEALINEYFLYPRYADRLDALGKEGVRRCYEYTLSSQRPLFTEKTKVPSNEEDIWIIASKERRDNYTGKSDSMIDHYYDKLLRLTDFSINNDYLMKNKEEMVEPLLEIVRAFSRGELTKDYMDTYINL